MDVIMLWKKDKVWWCKTQTKLKAQSKPSIKLWLGHKLNNMDSKKQKCEGSMMVWTGGWIDVLNNNFFVGFFYKSKEKN